MPWFLAAGGVLALEAFRFVRACFRIRGSSVVEPQMIRTTLFLCSRLRSSRIVPMTGGGGVELEASIFVRILSLCTSVWVPLTDILDKSVFSKIVMDCGFYI